SSAPSGSACTRGTLEISHVLRALRLPDAQARGSLRLTTGVRTTDEDVDRMLEVLPGIVERVRAVMPALAGTMGALRLVDGDRVDVDLRRRFAAFAPWARSDGRIGDFI